MRINFPPGVWRNGSARSSYCSHLSCKTEVEGSVGLACRRVVMLSIPNVLTESLDARANFFPFSFAATTKQNLGVSISSLKNRVFFAERKRAASDGEQEATLIKKIHGFSRDQRLLLVHYVATPFG